jgi:hypothetical protein
MDHQLAEHKPDNHMPPMDLTSAQLQAMLDYFGTLK